MGLKYKIVQSERKELDEIICDRCSKSIPKETVGQWNGNEYGKPYSFYHEPWFHDNYIVIQKTWGYHSTKDEETHEFVLCEACYDVLFAGIEKNIILR